MNILIPRSKIIKNMDKEVEVKISEVQINQLVYELYNLILNRLKLWKVRINVFTLFRRIGKFK